MATTANKRTGDFASLRLLGSCLFFCSLCLGTGVWAEQSGPAAARLTGEAANHRRTPDGNSRQKPQVVAKLWSGRISAPDPNEDAQTRLALKRLIRQVQSVQFDAKSTAPAAEPPAAIESTQAEPARQTVSLPADRQPENPDFSAIKTQRTLQTLLRDPNRVADPLEMAELLYLTGRLTNAAPFYQKALDRLGPNDPATDADRAWILWQLGNCLRESDVTKAQDTYARLIARYPNSPWTEMAKAHARILSWYQETQPQQWIGSEKP